MQCTLWQYGLWSFQTGYTKLERFFHKNQDTQRKLLNLENWRNGGGVKNCQNLAFKAYVSQEILEWHSLRHSHSAEF